MIVNSRMARLAGLDGDAYDEPSGELAEILDAGWTRVGPALALAALAYPDTAADDTAADPSRWELDTNDVHIPDQDLLPAPGTYLRRVAARGLDFAAAALGRARGLPGADLLVAVVGTGVSEDFLIDGTTVKFFVRRPGAPDWFDDLEGFELEAMALLDATDARSLPSGQVPDMGP